MTELIICDKLKLMKFLFVILLSVFPFLSSQAESLVKEDAKAYREEGFKAQSIGNLQNALKCYQKAIVLDPDFAQAYNDIGVVFESKGELKRAEEMYKKALVLDPNLLSVYTNLAFIAEKNGKIKEASDYWQKRYELGQEGDYWWEVSRQHLLKLGTYPKVKRDWLKKQALMLSMEVAQENEQKRLDLVKEAKFHFDIGNQAFFKKDYETAIKEFETIFFLNSPDKKVLDKSVALYKQAKRLYLRNKVVNHARDALDCIESDDYLSAEKKLGESLEAISYITQEK